MRNAAFVALVAGLCFGVPSRAAVSTGPAPSVLTITAGTSEREGADIATLNVSGIYSMDQRGSPNNVVILLWVGPHNEVTGVGWDVVLKTIAPTSRRSDIRMLVTNSLFGPVPNYAIQPGFADPSPGGPTNYSRDILKFGKIGRPNIRALSDGLIRLEFLDSPDDLAGEADAIWESGVVRFQTLFPVPAPVSPGTASLILVGVCSALRRRR